MQGLWLGPPFSEMNKTPPAPTSENSILMGVEGGRTLYRPIVDWRHWSEMGVSEEETLNGIWKKERAAVRGAGGRGEEHFRQKQQQMQGRGGEGSMRLRNLKKASVTGA